MKQSIFKKDFSVTGKNGTFTGSVIATLNYTTKTITGTHAVTHDDYTKQVPLHKVEAFISDKLWSSNDDIYTESSLLSISLEMMEALNKKLTALAFENPEPTFIEKMTRLFE